MVEIVCDKCKRKFRLGPANTLLTRYKFAHWLDWMASTCPYKTQEGMCNEVMLNFISQEVADFLQGEECATSTLSQIDEEIITQFCITKGIPKLEYHELSEREQHYVEFIHWLLERADYINQLGLEG